MTPHLAAVAHMDRTAELPGGPDTASGEHPWLEAIVKASKPQEKPTRTVRTRGDDLEAVQSRVRDTVAAVRPPRNFSEPRLAAFFPKQEWEGVVTSVTAETFVANLVDIKGITGDEVAEIYLDQVSDFDVELVRPGSVFYWGIGQRESHDGQRENTSLIRFRRLPGWTEAEIAAVKKRAAELANYFLAG